MALTVWPGTIRGLSDAYCSYWQVRSQSLARVKAGYQFDSV